MDLRYDRQTRLSQFGPDGQAALAASKVLVVGLGGLGIPVVQYLNAMGVGVLGLVDHDKVELHNLQRQVLYSEKDLLGYQTIEKNVGVALNRVQLYLQILYENSTSFALN